MSAPANDIAWIAVDWGTSTLRAWAIGRSDEVLAAARSDKGMSKVDAGVHGFEAALLEIAEPWLARGAKIPVIACGMVGSRQGWMEAPYQQVPTAPLDAEGLHQAPTHDPRWAISLVSGVCQHNPPDVMRGEETQISGLLSLSPGFDGVVVLPGTHTKWVQIVEKEIFHFASFMTGELFALLSKQSILRHSVHTHGFDEAAFLEAVDDSLSRPERFAAKLFSLRAADLLQGVSPERSSAVLTGVLLGLELAGARPYWLGQKVALVASGDLALRYEQAFVHAGISCEIHDPDECVLAGLRLAHAAFLEERAA